MSSSSRGRIYENPCLTLHQPWASLLVHGIKRVEGRSWAAPIRGRLWIHAARIVPDSETIKSEEDFYREIYAVDGITDIKFPEHYPDSKLLGCVDVVGCLRRTELIGWDAISEGVRLEERKRKFCWLCENPQTLIMPLDMRGHLYLYDLDAEVHGRAVQGLCSVKISSPVKFYLPDPQDPFSLKPGSLPACDESSEKSVSEKQERMDITGALAASKKSAKPYSKSGSRDEEAYLSEKQEKLDIAGALAVSSKLGAVIEDARAAASKLDAAITDARAAALKLDAAITDARAAASSLDGSGSRFES